MMKKSSVTYIILTAAILLMSACTRVKMPLGPGGESSLEMDGLVPVLTRAGGLQVADLKDYVGKDEFDNSDRAVFVSIKRTDNPIENFNYSDIEFICAKTVKDEVVSIGWSRDKSKGHTAAGGAETAPDRIYWSDATSAHTFTGFCAPQQGDGQKAFDWKEAGTSVKAYYGSIGDPTAAGDIDFRSVYTDDELVKSGNVELRKNDILLTHATDIRANDAIANLKFYHGLAQVRVIVNISDFAASDKDDKKAVVSDMVLNDMLTMYKWKEASVATEYLVEDDQAIIDGIYTGNPVAYDQKKNVKLWIPKPQGEGDGSSKTFTFYGMAVPTTISSSDKLDFSFMVTYPDPMKPEETKSHNYAASISNIRFDAGKCTTINISLNHMNEIITVGAEYDDWEFIDTPDEGELVKLSTFLKPSDFTSVTIHTDPKATADDATWLYTIPGGDEILDIYGHNGDETDPYLIKTAAQFLSFAKEVNEGGLDFQRKFITLDAGIILQPDNASSSVEWPGIGYKAGQYTGANVDHPFNGTLIGGVRLIKRLNGRPLFGYVGPLGHVEQLQLEDVLAVDGPSAFVYQNDGIICASKVSGVYGQDFTLKSAVEIGNLKKDETDNWSNIDWTAGDDAGTTTVAAPFAAINNGVLMACYCTGNFKSIASRNSGIVGYNNGAMVVDYSGNKCTSTAANPFYRGTVAYNRYNPDYFIEHHRPNESTQGATIQGSNFNICLKTGDSEPVYTKKHAIILEVGDDSDVLVATGEEFTELENVTWSVASSSVATFDNATKQLHAVAVGETKLIATNNSDSKTEYVRVVVVRKAAHTLGTHYGALTYCFYDKSIANNVNSGFNFGDVSAKTTAEMQSPSFIGNKTPAADPKDEDRNTLNGNLHYWSQHSELCPDIILGAYEDMLKETPTDIERALEQLCKHFLGRYYEFHPASYPWVY